SVEDLTSEQVREVVRNTMAITKRNPNRWKLYISLSFQKDVLPLMMKEMTPKVQPYLVSLHRFFEKQGHKNPAAVMRYFNAALDGISMQYIIDPENFPLEEVTEIFLNHFIPENP